MRTVPVTMLGTLVVDSIYHPYFRAATGLGSYQALDTVGFTADVANALIVQDRAKLTAAVDVIFQGVGDGHNAGDAANLPAAEAMPLIAQGIATLAP